MTVTELAATLGVKPAAIHKRMDRLGIVPKRFGSSSVYDLTPAQVRALSVKPARGRPKLNTAQAGR